MKICYWGKDGGDESRVWGFWLIEWKRLFSVVLLKFEPGTRDAYHTHAFDSMSWLLRGRLLEYHIDGRTVEYQAGWLPITTRRNTYHKVCSQGTSWALSFRGPWSKTWKEYTPYGGEATLANGRVRQDVGQ